MTNKGIRELLSKQSSEELIAILETLGDSDIQEELVDRIMEYYDDEEIEMVLREVGIE